MSARKLIADHQLLDARVAENCTRREGGQKCFGEGHNHEKTALVMLDKCLICIQGFTFVISVVAIARLFNSPAVHLPASIPEPSCGAATACAAEMHE